ncbi:hypothetical protein H4R33_007153, partial [Dimargaris cristalligena]
MAKRLLHNFLHYAQACLHPEQAWSDASMVSSDESRILLENYAFGGLSSVIPTEEPPASILCQFNRTVGLFPDCPAAEVSGQ